jgi:REP element-mobilizing transposase RayT
MRSRQQELRFTKGGKRVGAGRKPRGARAGVAHRPRPFRSARNPLHVTLKVVRDLPGLRRRHMWKAVQWALAITVRRPDFRICHVSIQGNHIHLIVEADDVRALARGMQGFQISCAKQMNARIVVGGARRRGRVFSDRYHARELHKPAMVRNALNYVLNNWRHHDEHLRSPGRLDRFSTAIQFGGWRNGDELVRMTPGLELLPASYPTTWLLTTGWKRHGLLSPFDRPGPEGEPP